MSRSDLYVGGPDDPDAYLLLERLGAGTEGSVWSARSMLAADTEFDVAVKQLAVPSDETDAERGRWREHARLLRVMAVPGVVGVVDVFSAAGPHRQDELGDGIFRYVVMELIDGKPLSEWSVDHPGASAPARLRKLYSTAAALDQLHRGAQVGQPIAHGDVKPENILVRDDGRTVLVDLGLIRVGAASGRRGHTAVYAAPEIRAGSAASPEADRYAFVATIAQVLLNAPLPTLSDRSLDITELQRRLQAHPAIARRPALAEQITASLRSPADARPADLGGWLQRLVAAVSVPTDGVPGAPEPSRRAYGSSGRPEAGDATRAGPAPTDGIPPSIRGSGALRRFGWIACAAVVASALFGALIPGANRTTQPHAGAATPTPSADQLIRSGSGSPAALPGYGCSGFTDLPSTAGDIDPNTPTVVYDVSSAGGTAKAWQLHPKGYIDQAFVATTSSIGGLATVPGIDFTVGPATAQLHYELHTAAGVQLGETLTVHVDVSNANTSVAADFTSPVGVQPGSVYFLRVRNDDAAPAIGLYVRSPAGQTAPLRFPACLIDKGRAALEGQALQLSGHISASP